MNQNHSPGYAADAAPATGQTGETRLALADFIAPEGVRDYVGAMAVSIHGSRRWAKEWEARNDSYRALLVSSLADRLVEAFAAIAHGASCAFCGIFGRVRRASCLRVPSQPDHQEKETVFTLLHAREEAGMSLTETWMMRPVSSVCALVFSHPESTYFSVGVTGEDQQGGLRLQKAGLPALTSPFPFYAAYRPDTGPFRKFLLEYATTLMGAGVHTNRAVRNISRIAAAYGYSADMTIFQRNITMSLICKDDETLRRTSVRKLKPLAFNLNLIQQLSELSWLPVDNNVSIAEMEQAFRSMVRTKRFSRWTDLLLVSVGNTAFCRLFNGDLWAMLTVFAATMLGFLAKQQLTRLKYNPLGVIILSAFPAASMAAACAVLFQIGSTPQIALATSVLFLVPGVQMINSIMDLMHGHILMGISRGIHSIMMIACIAIGLSIIMLIVGVNSL